MGKIKAVLFDCDGLMFNTERIAQKIWIDSAAENGIPLPDDFIIRITGAGGPDVRKYIEDVIGDPEMIRRTSAKRFDLDFWGSFEKGELVMKGLEELCAYLKANGYKIGIASSSSKAYVETLLRNADTVIEYDALCTGDMVKHAKPDPEIFLMCASLLGAEPEECLMLEDSRQGVLASQREGMHPGFVPDTIQADTQMEEIIEYTFADLSEVIGLLEEDACTAS